MTPHAARLLSIIGVLLLALALVAGSGSASAQQRTAPGSTSVHVRVWQDVHDPLQLYISARLAGGSWEALGTVPLHLDDTLSPGDRHGEVAVDGVEIRVWQQLHEPLRIRVGALIAGSEWENAEPRSLPLDDGFSSSGRYRYGNITLGAVSDALRTCGNGTVVAGAEQRPALVADCAVLLELRSVIDSSATLNWDGTTPITRWDGVTVDLSPYRVVGLRLGSRGLQGSVPAQLAALDALRALDLSHNELGGEIPPELGNLASLRKLWLHANTLSGEIPAELGALESLELVFLFRNALSGRSLPSSAHCTASGSCTSVGTSSAARSLPSSAHCTASSTCTSVRTSSAARSLPSSARSRALDPSSCTRTR